MHQQLNICHSASRGHNINSTWDSVLFPKPGRETGPTSNPIAPVLGNGKDSFTSHGTSCRSSLPSPATNNPTQPQWNPKTSQPKPCFCPKFIMRDISPVRAARPATVTAPSSLPHALALSVMRLTTPLPARTHGLPITSTPPTASALLQSAPQWESEGALCGVGSLTVIPSSFGSIYASETFRSFLSVFNQSSDPVHAVIVTVHIQTSSHRSISLLDTSKSPRDILEPRASINNIVKVALPELGVHKLLCAATYRTAANSSASVRTLRQTFRFNVLPPLDPSLSVRPLYQGLSSLPFSAKLTSNFVHYLVDLRVLNAVPVPVYATKATFVPKPPFRVRSLSQNIARDMDPLTEDGLNENIGEGRSASMGVGDARNFLFHVYRSRGKAEMEGLSAAAFGATRLTTSASEHLSSRALTRTDRIGSKSLRPVSSFASRSVAGIGMDGRRRKYSNEPQPGNMLLGHMTVSWRSALGEVGHLDNVVTAEEPVILRNDVEVFVYAVPGQINIHRPFIAKCAARNNTDRAVRLYLQVRRDLVGEIVPVGVSGVSLGEVQPGCTARCSITMIPLVCGQHSISGVRVVDIDSNMSYKADPPMLTVV